MVTIVRKEYALASPTNGTEVGKVLTAIRSEMCEDPVADDTVHVEARDSEVVFWFEVTS